MKNNPNDPYTENVRKEISEILVTWNMPTRQAAISEIVKVLERSLLTQRNEIKERIEGMKKEIPTQEKLELTESSLQIAQDAVAFHAHNQALTAASRAVDGEEK